MSDPITPEPAAPVSPSALMDTMSVEQRDTWRKTGAFPGDETPAAESVAQPAAEPAKVEAAPADDSLEEPEPAPGKPLSKRQQYINSLKRNEAVERLRAESAERRAAELEARLNQGRREDPAPPVPADDERPPVIDDFMDAPDPWAALIRATGRYEARQLLKEEREASDKAQREKQDAQTDEQRAKTYTETVQSILKERPDYLELTHQLAEQIHPKSLIGQIVTESPVGPHMLLHFAEHPEAYRAINSAPTPQAARDALWRLSGRIEAQHESKLASSASAAAAEPIKHVSSAPVLPVMLGSQAHAPVDDAEAALARGDFRAYKAEANRRDLAARR